MGSTTSSNTLACCHRLQDQHSIAQHSMTQHHSSWHHMLAYYSWPTTSNTSDTARPAQQQP
jgi:hypothetical protein